MKDEKFWTCGRAMSGYPGAFPIGFLDRIEEKFGIEGKKVLFPFGGSTKRDRDGSEKWVMNDIKPDLGDTTFNVSDLPEYWTDKFDVVVSDPPYGEKYANELYDTEHIGYKTILKESGRCVKPGGYLLILDFLVYQNYSQMSNHQVGYELERKQPIAVTSGPNQRIRVLNVFKKVRNV